MTMLVGMATKKQRKREERYRHHGVDRPRSPQIDEKETRSASDEAPKGKGARNTRAKAAPRGRKPVAYPTLFRCITRAPIFGLLWFVISRFFLGNSNNSVNMDALQALLLALAMVPLLFAADTVTYRLANRRGLAVSDRPADGWIGWPGKR